MSIIIMVENHRDLQRELYDKQLI